MKNPLRLPDGAKLPVDHSTAGVSGGFPENIGRFHEAVKHCKAIKNFFHSNSFRKKFTLFSLLVYRRHSLSTNK
jgi:hypothetical protein